MEENKMAQSRVFYLCDGERENCKKNTCYKNGGECKHTTDINHATNNGMKTEEKKATDTLRKLANKNFSLSDLDISFSYTREYGRKEKESEQVNRRFLREVEKRRDAIY